MSKEILAKEIAEWICEKKGVVSINGALYQKKVGYYTPLTRRQIEQLIGRRCRELAKKNLHGKE
ncbi:hypothetical protein NO1_1366 [Candidatus Termititenax aidoneus]|uniref:Uncharacterized protein n=1 Tax=Termititenax aidoneus TaxID=2218524 RepID=A0A388TC13_TERA1|nr:hypothetical protein NO1_1366 [Candidatus Termititenax aidoneus]